MEKLQDTLMFQQWYASLQSNGVTLKKVEELEIIRKPKGAILFALLKIDAYTQEGVPLLPIVFLRGHFVSIVTVIIEQETQEQFLLLVKQPRVCHGGYSYEHPAGMCDNENDLKKVCVKELHEETGLEISEDQIHQLTDRLVYSSPGLLDEGGYHFYTEITMPRHELEKLKGKLTGAKDESEFISTEIVPFHEASQKFINVHSFFALDEYLKIKKKS